MSAKPAEKPASPSAGAKPSPSLSSSLSVLLVLSLALHVPSYLSFFGDSVPSLSSLAEWSRPAPTTSAAKAGLWERSDPVASIHPNFTVGTLKEKGGGLLGMPWSTLDDYVCDTTYSGVRMLSRSPLLIVIDNFLRAGEPEHLIKVATPLYTRSTVVSASNDDPEFRAMSDYRTSSTAYIPRNGDKVIRCIEQRAAAFSGYPVRNTEGLQSVHYKPGQQYKVHHDYFPESDPSSKPHLARGGQRTSTFFVYLNDVDGGGTTWFPNVPASGPVVDGVDGPTKEGGVAVYARKGKAAFWMNVDAEGKPDDRTLHAGTPPLKGEKFGLNIWQREGEHD